MLKICLFLAYERTMSIKTKNTVHTVSFRSSYESVYLSNSLRTIAACHTSNDPRQMSQFGKRDPFFGGVEVTSRRAKHQCGDARVLK